MSESHAPRLEIILAQDEHAEAVAEFIREVWSPGATGASVLAARRMGAATNVAQPGIAPPTWIAAQQGRVLGYVTTLPIRLWDGTESHPAYWIKGLMVLPEFRGGPIGFHVLKAAAAALPLTGGLAVAAPARRLFTALGYRDLGAVPNWIRPIAPGRILARMDLQALNLSALPRWADPMLTGLRRAGVARPTGWLGGAALRAGAALLRRGGIGFEVSAADPQILGPELDNLWSSARGGYHSAVVRDRAYLLSRYPAGPEYQWVCARRRGRLTGIAVVRRPRDDMDPRLKGIRVATLADMVYDPGRPADGLALLGAVESAARSLAADAILAMTPAPALAALLRRQCYLALSGNVHFLFREAAPEGSRFGADLAGWWISRGDGQADEVF